MNNESLRKLRAKRQVARIHGEAESPVDVPEGELRSQR